MNLSEPIFDPDAHHDDVIRRGRVLRNRRRAGMAGAGVLAAVLVIAGVAAAAGGGGSGGRQVATSARSGSISTSLGAGGLGGDSSTTALAPGTASTLIPLIPLTTTYVPPSPTTAAGNGTGGPYASTTVPLTTVPVPTTVPVTTTVLAGAPACTPGQMSFATVSDKQQYAVDSVVAVGLQVRNTSGQTCSAPSYSGISARATITGPGDMKVPTNGPAISCTATCTPPVLVPGATTSYSAGEWSDAAPAGEYTVVATRNGFTGSAASFTVG
ncbi:MAG: hypothetical protein ACRDZ8_09875 [Acidimicrobiales bacterium]